MWVLIIMMWWADPKSPIVVKEIDFKSKETCNEANDGLKKMMEKQDFTHPGYIFDCVKR